MVSLANCYAKYVFFKIFALLLSSSWLMQRQMSPTEGLVSFGNRDEFDNFDKLLQLGNSNRIDRKNPNIY